MTGSGAMVPDLRLPKGGLATPAEVDGMPPRLAIGMEAALRQPGDIQAALLQPQRLQAIGELAASVEHEFNSAFAAIIGSYQVIERCSTEPGLHEVVRQGRSAAERAAALVRQLVAFARREELWLLPVALQPLLAEVEAMIRYTVGRCLAVTVRTEDHLRPVLTDPHRLEVALLTLAAHARDALPHARTLALRAYPLPPEDRPPPLEPGQYVAIALQAEGDDRPAGAGEATPATAPPAREPGLGLAVVRRFVEQSGGCLRIGGGAGLAVEVILPVALPPGEAPRAADGIGVLDPRLHGQAGILLVDGNDDLRAVSAGLLRDLGYTVAETASAEAASWHPGCSPATCW